jgi:hypothetical protein
VKHAYELISLLTKTDDEQLLLSGIQQGWNCQKLQDPSGRMLTHMAACCGRHPFIKNFISFIQDSQNLIQDLDDRFFPSNVKFFSADFESLYTNIYLNLALNIITDFSKDKLDESNINGFSVVGITTIDCEIKLKSIKQWLVFEVNSKTGLKNRTVNTSDIISSFSAEIHIPSNFLDYGIYRFTYQVSMDDDANAFTNSVDTFIRIVPLGMAIFPFSGGIKEITIGMGQPIDLDPGKYSYDYDALLMGTQLTYKFFCRMIIDGEPKEFPGDFYQHNIDLQEIKDKNFSIQLNSCFNNSGNNSGFLSTSILLSFKF